MKFKNYNICRALLGILALSLAPSFVSAQDSGYTRPSATTVPASDEEVGEVVSAIETRSRDGSSPYFASSIVLNGNDIYDYMSSTRSNTIAIAFGFSMAGNYNNANKVMVILPVDKNYQTIQGASCMLYSSGNMRFEPNTFETDRTVPSSSPQTIVPALGRTYVNNLVDNPDRDEVRGVLLHRSTLDKIIKNSRGAVANHIRLSFGMNGRGERIVMASSVDMANGMSTKQGPIEVLDATSLCPNNCEF